MLKKKINGLVGNETEKHEQRNNLVTLAAVVFIHFTHEPKKKKSHKLTKNISSKQIKKIVERKRNTLVNEN